MSRSIDPETIARAMKQAAWIAKHGTREQRAGRFIAPKPQSQSAKPDQKQSGDD